MPLSLTAAVWLGGAGMALVVLAPLLPRGPERRGTLLSLLRDVAPVVGGLAVVGALLLALPVLTGG